MFILAVDTLGGILRRNEDIHALQGIGPIDRWSVNHIQFADDTIICIKPSPEAIRRLRIILMGFSQTSGLEINFEKSSRLILGVPEPQCQSLTKLLGCPRSTLPFKYLGLQITTSRFIRPFWEEIIQKNEQKLLLWKSRLLSRAARVVLINAVITAIPLYILSYYKIPGWAATKIDRIRRNFFWGHTEDRRQICWIAWDKVCVPKERGGMGILNIRIFNESLLAKWWWKLLAHPESPWSSIIRGKYFCKYPVSQLVGRRTGHVSNYWKGISSGSAHFSANISWTPCDGRTIRFWKDRWAPQKILSDLFPAYYLSTRHKSCSFRDFVTLGRGLIRDTCFADDNEGIRDIIRSSNWCQSDTHDYPVWSIGSSGCFTVKSLYMAHDWDTPGDLRIRSLHSLPLSPCHHMFTWILIRDGGLPTLHRMSSRFPDWNIATSCKRCTLGDLESITHLFLDCPTSQQTWNETQRILNLDPRPAVSWWLQEQMASTQDDILSTLAALAVCREIWIGRNHLTFRGTAFHPPSIADRAISFLCAHLATLNDRRRNPLALRLFRLCGLEIQLLQDP